MMSPPPPAVGRHVWLPQCSNISRQVLVGRSENRICFLVSLSLCSKALLNSAVMKECQHEIRRKAGFPHWGLCTLCFHMSQSLDCKLQPFAERLVSCRFRYQS